MDRLKIIDETIKVVGINMDKEGEQGKDKFFEKGR